MYALIIFLNKMNDRTECGNYLGILLVAYAGNALLKTVPARLCTYCETEGLLPEEQCGFHPGRVTMNMAFAVSSLQELERNATVSNYTCVSSTCNKRTTPSIVPLVAVSRSLWSVASDGGSNPPFPQKDERLRAERR